MTDEPPGEIRDSPKHFIAGAPDDPRGGLAWCHDCEKGAKWIEGFGWLGHRNSHRLEIIQPDEFPYLDAPGWLGRKARAAYQCARRMTPQEVVRMIALSRRRRSRKVE